jgi:hypothetical protein
MALQDLLFRNLNHRFLKVKRVFRFTTKFFLTGLRHHYRKVQVLHHWFRVLQASTGLDLHCSLKETTKVT